MSNSTAVYVRLTDPDVPSLLRRFVDRYLAEVQSEPRFPALVRTCVDEAPADGDLADPDELRLSSAAPHTFTLYLRHRGDSVATVTRTEEGDLVLGLELVERDDPLVVRRVG